MNANLDSQLQARIAAACRHLRVVFARQTIALKVLRSNIRLHCVLATLAKSVSTLVKQVIPNLACTCVVRTEPLAGDSAKQTRAKITRLWNIPPLRVLLGLAMFVPTLATMDILRRELTSAGQTAFSVEVSVFRAPAQVARQFRIRQQCVRDRQGRIVYTPVTMATSQVTHTYVAQMDILVAALVFRDGAQAVIGYTGQVLCAMRPLAPLVLHVPMSATSAVLLKERMCVRMMVSFQVAVVFQTIVLGGC